MALKLPFEARNMPALMNKMLTSAPPPLPQGYSEQLQELAFSMLEKVRVALLPSELPHRLLNPPPTPLHSLVRPPFLTSSLRPDAQSPPKRGGINEGVSSDARTSVAYLVHAGST
jgi:hypothetical protein